MKSLGIPPGAMKQKMIMDGLTDEEIAVFLGEKPPVIKTNTLGVVPEAEFMAKHEAAKLDPQFKKYVNMQKMGIPDGALRTKMIQVSYVLYIMLVLHIMIPSMLYLR